MIRHSAFADPDSPEDPREPQEGPQKPPRASPEAPMRLKNCLQDACKSLTFEQHSVETIGSSVIPHLEPSWGSSKNASKNAPDHVLSQPEYIFIVMKVLAPLNYLLESEIYNTAFGQYSLSTC